MSSYEDGAAYACQVVDDSFGKSSNGHDMITIRIVPIALLPGYPSVMNHREPVSSGFERDVRLVFPAKGKKQAEFNVKKLKHAGVGDDLDISAIHGSEVVCINTHSEGSNGKTYDNFDLALPPMQAKSLEKSQGEVRKRLRAKLGNLLSQTKVSPAIASDQQHPEDSRESEESGVIDVEDDDIPF